MNVQRIVWFPNFSAFRLYVGQHVSRHILCLHSIGVVARTLRALIATWVVAPMNRRIRGSIPSRDKVYIFSAPQRPDRLWGPPSFLAFGTEHLSSDEVTVATRSSFWLLNFFFNLKEHALSLTCWVLGALVTAGIAIVRVHHHHHHHCHCQWPVHSTVY